VPGGYKLAHQTGTVYQVIDAPKSYVPVQLLASTPRCRVDSGRIIREYSMSKHRAHVRETAR
jgi:hypothetical protein